MKNAHSAVTSGKADTCEICMNTASGAKKYLRVTVRMIARSGDRYLFYCVLSDINEQRVAEIKEHDMAVQLETIMENIHGGITATVFHDKNNIEIVFTNEGFYEMYGYTREQFEAELPNMLDLIIPEDRKKTMETVERIVRERGTATYEYRCRKRDGSIIWVQVTNSVIEHNGTGNTVLLAASSDVTELRRAQESELESAERLRTVMDHAGNGISAVAIEAAGPRLLFVNDKFFDIMGYTKESYEKLTQGDMFNIICPEEREQIRGQVLSIRKPGDTKTIDYRITRQDESVAWIRAIVTITALSGVQSPVQIAVFSDITGEKEASTQLRFLNDSAREILAQPDSERAVNDTLRRVVDYFGADRGYVVELDSDRMLARGSYEIHAEGIPDRLSKTRAVPYGVSDLWYSALVQKHYFILEDIRQLDEAHAELRKLFESQNIRSMILAPLWRDGVLIGFAGVDNPSRAVNQLEQLTALSDFIAVLLTRRDLSRRIKRDAEAMRSLPVRLLDNLPHGAALYRFDGKNLSVVHINKRYWELVEREPVDYGKASVLGVIHPDDRDAACGEIETAIRNNREAVVNLRILCGKDIYKPFRVVANISREKDGNYLVYASYTLISEHNMSIQEMIPIAISAMMSSSDNLSYVKDREMRYICVSQSVADMAGLSSPGDMTGKTTDEIFDKNLTGQFDTDDKAILNTGTPIVGKVESVPFADGSVHTVRTSKYPIKDSLNSIVGVYSLSIDITTQREALERLRVSEELNRLAIEHSGNIVTKFDVKTRTLTMPEKYSPIFEVPSVLYNVPDEQIKLGRISPETSGAYAGMFESIIRGEPTGSTVYQQSSTKGWRWLSAQFTTVFSDGEPTAALISFSDVTERTEKELVYTKWQQSLTARPEDSYTLFRCNLSRGSSYDSREGKLLDIDFDESKDGFDERTAEYISKCVSPDDRERYAAFMNSTTARGILPRSPRIAENRTEESLVRLTVTLWKSNSEDSVY